MPDFLAYMYMYRIYMYCSSRFGIEVGNLSITNGRGLNKMRGVCLCKFEMSIIIMQTQEGIFMPSMSTVTVVVEFSKKKQAEWWLGRPLQTSASRTLRERERRERVTSSEPPLFLLLCVSSRRLKILNSKVIPCCNVGPRCV